MESRRRSQRLRPFSEQVSPGASKTRRRRRSPAQRLQRCVRRGGDVNDAFVSPAIESASLSSPSALDRTTIISPENVSGSVCRRCCDRPARRSYRTRTADIAGQDQGARSASRGSEPWCRKQMLPGWIVGAVSRSCDGSLCANPVREFADLNPFGGIVYCHVRR